METSGPPYDSDLVNPTYRKAILPPPAFEGPRSAPRVPSIPSHTMPIHSLRVLRNDEIVDVRRALRREGLPSTMESGLSVLHSHYWALAPCWHTLRFTALPRGGAVCG
jgi:hypothetical protein